MKQSAANVDMSFFTEALTEEVQKAGGVIAVAEQSGISRQMVRRYMDGAEPSLTALLKLSSTFGCSIDSLVGIISDSFTTEEYSAIPYLDLYGLPKSFIRRHSAYADKILGKFLFSPPYCEQEYHSDFSDLRLFLNDDDNMMPNINKGDICLISVDKEHLDPSDGVFLLKLEKSVMVRRLQLVSKEKIVAMADNSLVDSFSFVPGEVEILGRVMMCMSNQ